MQNNEFFDFDDVEVEYKEPDVPKKIKGKSEKIKTIGLFDHLKAITDNDYDSEYFDNLSERAKKTFDVYMINRFLSMNPDWVYLVNYFQQYTQFVSRKEVYAFYSSMIPTRRIFLKYIKGEKEAKYNAELINLVRSKYEVSKKEALEYLEIFYMIPGGIKALTKLCQDYGNDEKEIKKLLKKKE